MHAVIAQPFTAVTCTDPPEITNGTRTPSATRSLYYYGEEISYECNDGSKFIDGERTRIMKCVVALDDDGMQIIGQGAWNNGEREATADADVTCRSTVLSLN